MKKISATALLTLCMSINLVAQKKLQKLHTSAVVNVTAKQLWKVIGEDYGAIANITPHLVSSKYIDSSKTMGSEGCERECKLNESGSKFIKEKMINYDPTNMSFTNIIYQIERLPLESSQAVYKVEAIDSVSCKIVLDMQYRTKPAFMGRLAKGKFRKMTKDIAIFAEHYIKTGDKITKKNYKKIKRDHKKKGLFP